MVSVASAGTADRIAARILFKVLRAGSGTPARYWSTFFGARLLFAAELRLPDFTFFMRAMLQEAPISSPRLRPAPTMAAYSEMGTNIGNRHQVRRGANGFLDNPGARQYTSSVRGRLFRFLCDSSLSKIQSGSYASER